MSEVSSLQSFSWFAPITSVKGVGEKLAAKLKLLQINRMGDLLLHLPFRYEDRTRLTPISLARPEQSVVVQGEIIKQQFIRQKKSRHLIIIKEAQATLSLVFFNYHPKGLKEGDILRCFGQIKWIKRDLCLINPDWQLVTQELPLPWHLNGIYPTTQGLSQKWLQKTILRVLNDYLLINTKDILQEKINEIENWQTALRTIHMPSNELDTTPLLERTHPSYQRLIIEEVIANHLSLKRIKSDNKSRRALAIELEESLLIKFLKRLPFELTQAQQAAWSDIRQDLAKTIPMQRLVQGDVGCGKTVVAALSALAVISQGKQVALMVPTEILAKQHFEQFLDWFTWLGIKCELLIGSLKTKEKKAALNNINTGLSKMVIGTHALFQEKVLFHQLNLVIIDEQHRFGVGQRLELQRKGMDEVEIEEPHQLTMTATPIPRTLMMSQYSHVDLSIINSLPPGRQPIQTIALSQTKREDVITRLRAVCDEGQQVYWVCTLINESDLLEAQAAESTALMLTEALPGYKIGLIHGKLSALEKEQLMQAFYDKQFNILVATTVIEVGVNVPNATLMVIENPERMGLAQLHQLRGRVGRGLLKSFCILLYQSPLSEMAQARLNIMRQTQDGFVIAEEDLNLRGPGEVLGLKQTGLMQFKVANLSRDRDQFRKLPHYLDKISSLPSDYVNKIIKRWCPHEEFSQV